MRRRDAFAGLALLAVQAGAGAHSFRWYRGDESGNMEGKLMKTHAVGRHRVDLPEGFVAGEMSSVNFVYGLDADFQKVEIYLLARQADKQRYQEIVRARIETLQAQQNDVLNCPMLIEHASEGSEFRHRVRSYSDILVKNFLRSEIYALVGTSVFRISANSERKENVVQYEERLRLVAANGAQSGPERSRGFCIGDTVFDVAHDQEVGEIYFRDPARPRAKIAVRVDAITDNPDKSLLERWDENNGILSRMFTSPFRTARRGNAKLAGMNAQELLLEGRFKGNLVLVFEAESRRSDRGFAAPYLDLTLEQQGGETGSDPGGPYWTLDEGIAIWDKMLATLALRPGAV